MGLFSTVVGLFQNMEVNVEKGEKKRIRELQAEIKKYNDAYYSQNKSLISDHEYDMKMKELEALEAKYPDMKTKETPTENVGSSLKNTKFQKVKHDVPMISLANSYNIKDIEAFTDRVYKNSGMNNLVFALEVKLDGLSISIHYKDGVLTRAVTRGDGNIGEDVTENIMQISSIPKKLRVPITCEVRGEVVFPLSNFKKLNDMRLQNGEETFANARNAASGTLRQLDPRIVAERGLDAYFYYLVNAEEYAVYTQHEAIDYLRNLGFKTTGICEPIYSLDNLHKRIEYWDNHRKSLDYDTDGMVIKVDDIPAWRILGQTNKVPRWAIAYKFPAMQVTTKLKDVTWQVGRTGRLTPVAELQTVELSGSMVSRATLHNLKLIHDKDIRIGDTVFIEKAAEIIPQVVKPVVEARLGSEKQVKAPSKCPQCGGNVSVSQDKVNVDCINPECPAKMEGAIIHFVSRECMNIKGLGEEIVKRFIKVGLLCDVTDIYNLKNHRESLINLEGMGEKSVDSLLSSIEASKNMPYAKVLYALGIPNIGDYLAKLLAEASGNVVYLLEMSVSELTQINGIAEVVATSVVDYFNSARNLDIILKLKRHGLNFSHKPKGNTVGKLSGMTFLFTGKLTKFTRTEAQKLVDINGGTNLGSVSKALKYIVVGEDAGSKLDKAKELGTVNIITEDEFLNMIK